MYYRDYINHPLNKSPSKQAYSFGKTERFKPVGEKVNKEVDDNKSTISRKSRRESADQKC